MEDVARLEVGEWCFFIMIELHVGRFIWYKTVWYNIKLPFYIDLLKKEILIIKIKPSYIVFSVSEG